MPAEARITKLWVQQKGLIPFLFLGFSLYFLWDGLVGYPRSDARWTEHERLKEQPAEWEKLCAERGWKTEPPEKFLGPKKYLEQYIFAGITGAIGLIALVYWLRQRKTLIRSDEQGVLTPSGRQVPYAAITHVDRRLWKAKGLATVRYTLNGHSGIFKLDDAKHDPKALDVILDDIASKSPQAKVEHETAAQ